MYHSDSTGLNVSETAGNADRAQPGSVQPRPSAAPRATSVPWQSFRHQVERILEGASVAVWVEPQTTHLNGGIIIHEPTIFGFETKGPNSTLDPDPHSHLTPVTSVLVNAGLARPPEIRPPQLRECHRAELGLLDLVVSDVERC